jgi:hypothetical protein
VRSLEQGSDEQLVVLLGRLSGEDNEQGKASLQQQHPHVRRGMQRIFRKRHFPLQQLCQWSAGELPPALPHIPSQQGIRMIVTFVPSIGQVMVDFVSKHSGYHAVS